jgi:putative flippase GtrA
MEAIISLSRRDIVASLVIGEICAWLLIAIIKSLAIGVPALYALPVYFPVLCAIGLYLGYLIGKKIPVIYQIAKFILVGGFNTLVDWGVLAFLIYLFSNYFFAGPQDTILTAFGMTFVFYTMYKSISFIVASVNSYFWNKFWTFKRETTEHMSKEFLQFFIVTIIGFLINVAIASTIFRYVAPAAGLSINQWSMVAAVVATAVSMVWNFIGYKFIVFNEPKKEPVPETQAVPG